MSCLQFEQLSVVSLRLDRLRAGRPNFIDENIKNWAAEQNIQNFKNNVKKVKNSEKYGGNRLKSVQENLSAILRSSFGINYKSGSSWKSEKVGLF